MFSNNCYDSQSVVSEGIFFFFNQKINLYTIKKSLHKEYNITVLISFSIYLYHLSKCL